MAVCWLAMLSGLAPVESGEQRVRDIFAVDPPWTDLWAGTLQDWQGFNSARQTSYWKQLPLERGCKLGAAASLGRG